jgi:hypothetical protein
MTEKTNKIKFNIPSVLKDSLIIIVEIIKPEFLITVLNLSECKNENNKIKTSTKIKIVKKSSKNILLISSNLYNKVFTEKKLEFIQLMKLYRDKNTKIGINKEAILFLV